MTAALKKDFDETAFKNDVAKFQKAVDSIKWFDEDSLNKLVNAFTPLNYRYRGTDALTQFTVETIQDLFKKNNMGAVTMLTLSYFVHDHATYPSNDEEGQILHNQRLPVLNACIDIIKDVVEHPRTIAGNSVFWPHWLGQLNDVVHTYGGWNMESLWRDVRDHNAHHWRSPERQKQLVDSILAFDSSPAYKPREHIEPVPA